jgi:hypothetical protein
MTFPAKDSLRSLGKHGILEGSVPKDWGSVKPALAVCHIRDSRVSEHWRKMLAHNADVLLGFVGVFRPGGF